MKGSFICLNKQCLPTTGSYFLITKLPLATRCLFTKYLYPVPASENNLTVVVFDIFAIIFKLNRGNDLRRHCHVSYDIIRVWCFIFDFYGCLIVERGSKFCSCYHRKEHNILRGSQRMFHCSWNIFFITAIFVERKKALN